MATESGEAAFRAVPVRLYRPGLPYVQRPVSPRSGDGQPSTLRHLIDQLIPDQSGETRLSYRYLLLRLQDNLPNCVLPNAYSPNANLSNAFCRRVFLPTCQKVEVLKVELQFADMPFCRRAKSRNVN